MNWKPSDIEQREGRIIRQGNLLLEKYGDEFEVEVAAYATERTYDAKMWSLNETKGRFINGLRAYKGEREVEIDDEGRRTWPKMAAMASGDPRILERVQLDAEVKKLGLLRARNNRRQQSIEGAVRQNERDLRELPDGSEAAKATTLRFSTRSTPQSRIGQTARSRWRAIHEPVRRSCRGAVGHPDRSGRKPGRRNSASISTAPLTSLTVSDAIRSGLGDASPLPLVMERDERVQAARTHQGRACGRCGRARQVRQRPSVRAGTYYVCRR